MEEENKAYYNFSNKIKLLKSKMTKNEITIANNDDEDEEMIR